MIKPIVIAAGLTAALTTIASPALAQDRWDWSGGRPGDRAYCLVGRGVPGLYPELRDTPRGRAFVMRNFDRNRDGFISPPEATDANRAFAAIAGDRRDRFDWEARDRTVVVETREVLPGGWDRRAMHDYGFRQTPRGATLRLQDEVLFATDSAVLRPGAIDRLRALADTDRLRAWLLLIGGVPAAYLCCTAQGSALRYDHVRHDPALNDLSPGTVLQAYAFEDLFGDRFARFDFTEGEGQHKRQFATGGIACVDLLLLRPTLANRMTLAALAAFDGAMARAKRATRHPRLAALAKLVRR